jgi:hypothetical protein
LDYKSHQQAEGLIVSRGETAGDEVGSLLSAYNLDLLITGRSMIDETKVRTKDEFIKTESY